jgi:hypothetical protein
LASDAVRRIDAIFAMEREINGAAAEQRRAVRQERIKPLVIDLEAPNAPACHGMPTRRRRSTTC